MLDINKVLMLEVDEEQRYRFTVEKNRDLWKERYGLAEKRVKKLKGSRLKWLASAVPQPGSTSGKIIVSDGIGFAGRRVAIDRCLGSGRY